MFSPSSDLYSTGSVSAPTTLFDTTREREGGWGHSSLPNLFALEEMRSGCSSCLDWGAEFVLIESQPHCVVVWTSCSNSMRVQCHGYL